MIYKFAFDSGKFKVYPFSVIGLDIPKHGEPAYPVASYGDGWSAGTANPYLRNLPVYLNLGFQVDPTENSKPQSPNETAITNRSAHNMNDTSL